MTIRSSLVLGAAVALTAPVLAQPAVYPLEFRSIDGTRNNLANPTWGSAGSMFLRKAPVGYGDGTDTPAGSTRPNPRTVSNGIVAQDTDRPSFLGLSNWLWQWGQFIDHDLDETPFISPPEFFNIQIPAGDPWFDPFFTGTVEIPLERSHFGRVGGVRQQVNELTAYIDASQVYGADDARARELRAMDGTGRLKTSPGNLLPFNVNGFRNFPTDDDASFFLGGDIRANEQTGLLSTHTLFLREHNYWADQIAAENPGLSDEEIYQRARGIVAGTIQAITYREFLPRLLGPDAIPPYTGYDPNVNVTVANEFATAAYRVGHTALAPILQRIDANLDEHPAGHLSLRDAFFVPEEVIDHGIDIVLRGLAFQRSQQIDAFVIDDVRNFLFGPPGAGGFDLASLNIQRGRDHGLADYNAIRVAYGLAPMPDLASISDDPFVQSRFMATYSDVNDVDAWVGLLAEPPVPGAQVGEGLRAVLSDQFRRARDGDRFWYQSYLPADIVAQIESETLADVIRRNTGVGAELPDDVFIVPLPCPGDFDGSGGVDFLDLVSLLSAWGPCPTGCQVDLDGSGDIGLPDLLELLSVWGPCP